MRIPKKLILFVAMTTLLCSSALAGGAKLSPAARRHISHIEPLSWWVGMSTPLQLMIHGERISDFDLRIEGGGVTLEKIHRAESPNYLFVDISIDKDARPGERQLVFERGRERFSVPYLIGERRVHSRDRQGFTTADMIYLLMPDRFANGDPRTDSTPDTAEKPDRGNFFGRHGGDLQGMIDHLDYISDLGATAIWSTPLLLDNEPVQSYHGYACGDYYRIDPRYGSNELYREYVAKAHEKGLKVIMDVVTNHCGGAHWWMKDLPFEDWVHQFEEFTPTNNIFSANFDPNASKYDLKIQESGWFDKPMPDMNLDNPYLLRYFQQWIVWWIEYADLDGLRVDTYPYNEKIPMSHWCEAVNREYPDLNIVGECWTPNPAQLAYWQGGNPNRDGFDSHLRSIMDFPLRDAICQALPTDSLRWGEGMIRVYEALSNDFVYHSLDNMMIMTGNHDTDRLGDIVRGNWGRAKIAMTLLATMRGIPQIFAGDELMFRSKDPSQGHGGLRVDFPGGWAGDERNLFEAADRTKEEAGLFDFTRKIFNWRKGKAVIHHGRTLHFASRDNTYAYFRYDDKEAVFVFVNNSRGRKTIPWSHYAEITEGLCPVGRNVETGEEIRLSEQTAVPARDVLVVELKRK